MSASKCSPSPPRVAPNVITARRQRLRTLGWLLVPLLVAACPASRGTGAGRRDEGDIDKATIIQREGARAAAADLGPGLANSDAELRARTVLALGRLERLDAVEPILGALKDKDAAVRRGAAFAAGQLDLAIDPKRPSHETQRQNIETALTAALSAERDLQARLALIRALGRIGSRSGLDALVPLATGTSAAERREALFAIGVSGARRQASRKDDAGVLASVAIGLADADDDVRAAAAYAAFRQKLVLPKDAVDAALTGGPQTRIFLARSMAAAGPAVADSALPTLLDDPDWRVQIEALRATAVRADRNADLIPAVLTAAVGKGQRHVVTEACLLLADIGAPTALPAVTAAVAGLTGADSLQARCSCAAAIEVLGGDDDAVETCSQGQPPEFQQKMALTAIEHARTPSPEKAKAAGEFFRSENIRVRMAAASVVCADPTFAAADVAAARLIDEPDPGVSSALLECFVDGKNADVLQDRTISQSVQRFLGGTDFEHTEPLLALAALTRTRPGPTMQALRDTLLSHSDARVRDAAKDVPAGERAPGPRALALPEVAFGKLPVAALLHTSRGDILIAFERELAPRTVKSFADLAAKGTFNGTPFHRVIADFVSQGGDPRGDGSGGPGFTLPCENSDAPYTRGAVGMATAGKDTGGSQFFLTHSHQPHLDGRYTLFARVVDGDDVMDALQKDDLLLSVELTTALRKAAR